MNKHKKTIYIKCQIQRVFISLCIFYIGFHEVQKNSHFYSQVKFSCHHYTKKLLEKVPKKIKLRINLGKKLLFLFCYFLNWKVKNKGKKFYFSPRHHRVPLLNLEKKCYFLSRLNRGNPLMPGKKVKKKNMEKGSWMISIVGNRYYLIYSINFGENNSTFV